MFTYSVTWACYTRFYFVRYNRVPQWYGKTWSGTDNQVIGPYTGTAPHWSGRTGVSHRDTRHLMNWYCPLGDKIFFLSTHRIDPISVPTQNVFGIQGWVFDYLCFIWFAKSNFTLIDRVFNIYLEAVYHWIPLIKETFSHISTDI